MAQSPQGEPPSWLPWLLGPLAGVMLALLDRIGRAWKARNDKDSQDRKTALEGERDFRSDLRETERYLRQQLRDLELDNQTLRRANADLVIAHAELKAENRTLQVEVRELKEQNTALAARLDALEGKVN